MKNRQEIVADLVEEKLAIQRICSEAKVELDRLTFAVDKFTEEIKALDTVIKLYNDKTSSNTSNDAQKNLLPTFIDLEKSQNEQQDFVHTSVNGNGNAEKKSEAKISTGVNNSKRSYRQVGKEVFKELPEIYTKSDVESLILFELPNVSSINENTLRGIMNDYVNDGWAVVFEASNGRTQQKYKKLV
jgi:predicted  nucleic acid-binding Zn-ribbon protein